MEPLPWSIPRDDMSQHFEWMMTMTTSSQFRVKLVGKLAALALLAPIALMTPVGSHSRLHAEQVPAAANVNFAQPVSFADVVDRVKPAVISVRVTRQAEVRQMGLEAVPGMDNDGGQSPFEQFMRRFGEGRERGQRGGGQPYAMSQGSGFFISADGYAVTNNHVVEGAREVTVVTDNGRQLKAKVVGTDPRTDIALLKVDGESGLPFVGFTGQPPRVGDWVLAVGNPFGLGGTVTAGIVSARGRDIGSGPYDDFVQIDAPINKGNSGGPTFNAKGEVIGVNTAIYSPSGGNVGIAFAIPADTVQTVIAQLRDKGAVSRGWIGVQIQPVTPEIAESLGLAKPEGALVAGVQPGSPAETARLKASDVITAVDGEKITSARDLTRRIGALKPEQKVRLTVLRDGKEQSLQLVLGNLASAEKKPTRLGQATPEQGDLKVPRLGLTLGESGLDGKGVPVTGVDPEGLAARQGIRNGDVIVEVAGRAVASTEDIRRALAEAGREGRRAALVRLQSGQEMRFVAIPLAAG